MYKDLLSDLARWPHVALSEIRSCRVAMPQHEPPAGPGHEHNHKILARWREREEKAKHPLGLRMAELLSRVADDRAGASREWPDEVPEELLSLPESPFEVVSKVMHDDGLAA